MRRTRQIHDGIVGAIITAGIGLGMFVDPVWLWVPGIVGLLMVQSAVTGFCPVYFLLHKLGMSETAPGATPAA